MTSEYYIPGEKLLMCLSNSLVVTVLLRKQALLSFPHPEWGLNLPRILTTRPQIMHYPELFSLPFEAAPYFHHPLPAPKKLKEGGHMVVGGKAEEKAYTLVSNGTEIFALSS